MTLEIHATPEEVPYIMAALMHYAQCPDCRALTNNAPVVDANGRLQWPCRPCRAKAQQKRYIHRRENPNRCSVGGCEETFRYNGRFCKKHKPNFGR